MADRPSAGPRYTAAQLDRMKHTSLGSTDVYQALTQAAQDAAVIEAFPKMLQAGLVSLQQRETVSTVRLGMEEGLRAVIQMWDRLLAEERAR